MNSNQQIGGDYTCSKCGQHCSGGVYHECPKDKLPREVILIEEELKEVEHTIINLESDIVEAKNRKRLLEKILNTITPKEKKEKKSSSFFDMTGKI